MMPSVTSACCDWTGMAKTYMANIRMRASAVTSAYQRGVDRALRRLDCSFVQLHSRGIVFGLNVFEGDLRAYASSGKCLAPHGVTRDNCANAGMLTWDSGSWNCVCCRMVSPGDTPTPLSNTTCFVDVCAAAWSATVHPARFHHAMYLALHQAAVFRCKNTTCILLHRIRCLFALYF